MKRLAVSKWEGFDPATEFPLLEIHRMDSDNWNLKSPVKAGFGIGYDAQNIYLRYIVKESNIRAIYLNTHDPVHEDSCVEFFVTFDRDAYYNLEFNCIGTIHAAYGKNRYERERLKEGLLKTIQTTPSLGTGKIDFEGRETEWTLDVIIPFSIFIFTDPGSLQNKSVHGNFYKCGDKQLIPHYLSWNPILSEKPDFHRPEYFGEIKFV
jgi:hypothetical protein